MVKPALDTSLAFEQSPDDVMEPRPLDMNAPMPMNTLPSFDDFEDAPDPVSPANIPSFDDFEDEPGAPRDVFQQAPTDSPGLLTEVLNTFDTLGKYTDEAVESGRAAYTLGRGLRQGDPAQIEEGMNAMRTLPKPPENQSWYDKTLQVAASIIPSIFTPDRLTAAVDSMKAMPIPLTVFNAAAMAPAAVIGAAGMYDADALAGGVGYELLNAGVDPDTARLASVAGGAVGSAIGWTGLGKISMIVPATRRKIVQEAVTNATVEVLKRTGKLQGAIKTAGEFGGELATGAVTMGAIEINNIFAAEFGKAISNNVDGTQIPQTDIDHAVQRVIGAVKTGALTVGIVSPVLRGAGAALANKDLILKGKDSVDVMLEKLKAKEKSERDLAVANIEKSKIVVEGDGAITEKLSFEEDASREQVTDSLFKAPEENLDAIIERTVLTREGKDSRIPLSEHAAKVEVLKEKIYRLNQELNSKEGRGEVEQPTFEASKMVEHMKFEKRDPTPEELARLEAAEKVIKNLEAEGEPPNSSVFRMAQMEKRAAEADIRLAKEGMSEEVVFTLAPEEAPRESSLGPAPVVKGSPTPEMLARQDAAKAAVKALDDAGVVFTAPEMIKAVAEWQEASKAVREARKAGEEPGPDVPRAAGITERKNRAMAREKELKDAGRKTSDPERAAVRRELAVLRSLRAAKLKEKKALQQELKDLEQMTKDPTVTKAEEALIRAELARDRAQELAEPGWLDPGPDVPEMTKAGHDEFRAKMRQVIVEAKKAERQGDKNGLARGKALVRQMIDERRREQRVNAERNKLVRQIHDTIRKGARKDGKTDADTTSIFQTLKTVMKASKEDLAAYLDGTKALPEGANQAIMEGLLRIRQDKRRNSIGGLREILDAVTEIREQGTETRFAALLDKEMAAVADQRGALTELLGERPYEQIKTKGMQVGDAVTKLPRGPHDLFLRYFNKPGYFVTGNWMGIARILMRDMTKGFKDSTIYKLFDHTLEARKRGVLHRELASEYDSMIKTTYGKNGTMTDKELFDFKFQALTEVGKPILDGTGNPIFTVGPQGEKISILLNRFERIRHAADLYNPGLKKHYMQTKGYTEEMIAAIQDLPAQDQVMLDLTLSYFRKTHGLKNEVFRRQNGYDLPIKESYAGTVHREGFNAEMNVDPLLRSLGEAKPTASNIMSLMESVEYSDQPIVIQNLLAGLESEASDTAHYVAFAEKVDHWRRVLLDKKFIQGVGARFDKQTAGEINAAILNHMKDIGRGRTTFEPPTPVDFIRKNVVRGLIFGKAMVGIKQVNSFVNFAVENGVSIKDFWSGIKEALADLEHTSRVMDELSPTIKARGVENIDVMFTHRAMTDRAPLGQKVKKAYMDQEFFANKYLSLPIVLGDRAAVKLGGYALYKGLLKQVEAGKMTLEEASLRVEETMNRTQQTSEVSYQTPFQKSQNPVSKIASSFSTGVFSLMRMGHEAVFDMVKLYEQIGREGDRYNTLREAGASPEELASVAANIDKLKASKMQLAGQTAKTLLVAHSLSAVLYTLASNYGVPEWGELGAAAILGPTGGIPFVGPALESVVRSWIGVKPYPGGQDIVSEVLSDFAKSMSGKNQSSPQRWMEGVLNGAQTITPVPLVLSERVAYSAADDLMDGDLGRFLLTVTGATPKKVDELTK